jgi:D-alanyl-D-alanine carboxypeptidase/D-alanyl-D-alanine-endopeptidase (penicillin-binding protein 4)
MRRTSCLLVTLLLVFAAVNCSFAVAAGAGTRCQVLRQRLIRGGGLASGLYIADAQTGKPLCARAARTPRSLASNTKLFTTSTALGRFGPEAHIETRVVAEGPIDKQGVLHGNLYLKGGGDPALGSPAFYDAFHGGLGTNLFALTRQLRNRAGLTAVTGRLYADDTIFDRLRGVSASGYATSVEIGPLSGLDYDSGFASTDAHGFASDPAKLAARKLDASLRGAGVSIRPQVALGETPEETGRGSGVRTVASIESPSISAIVNFTDVNSDNFFAEMLVKLIGAHFGAEGSTAAGVQVVEEFAHSKGTGIQAVDGSGLNHANRASPLQVARLLETMRESKVGAAFVSDLALAGHEGTVAERMHGTAADGRCRTKTGTLTGVSNLSGYCFNRDGRVMVFSVLMNGVRDLDLAHTEQDRIAAAVASY